jgi:hypothetical protein
MDLREAAQEPGRRGFDPAATMPEIPQQLADRAAEDDADDATDQRTMPNLHAPGRFPPADPTIPSRLPREVEADSSAGEVELVDELPGEPTRVEPGDARHAAAPVNTATEIEISGMVELAPPPAPAVAVAAPRRTGDTVRVARAEVERMLRLAPDVEPEEVAAATQVDVDAVVRRVRDEEAKRRRHDLEVALRAERERGERERAAERQRAESARAEAERRYRAQIERLESDLVGQIERLRGRLDDAAPTAPAASPLPLPAATAAALPPPMPRLQPSARPFHDDEEAPTALTRESLDPPTGVIFLPPATEAVELLAGEPLPWEPDPLAVRKPDLLIARRTLGDVVLEARAAVRRSVGRPAGALVAAGLAGALATTALAGLVAAGSGDIVERAAGAARAVALAERDDDGARLDARELASTLAGVRETLAAVAATTGDAAGEAAVGGRDGDAPARGVAAVAGRAAGKSARAPAVSKPKRAAHLAPRARPKPVHTRVHARSAVAKRAPASDVVRDKLAALDDAERAEADEETAALDAKRAAAKKAHPGDPFPLDLVF